MYGMLKYHGQERCYPHEFELPLPVQPHVHLRQGEMLRHVVGATARQFGPCIVMPNTKPPICTDHEAEDYREQIMDAAEASVDNLSPAFNPLMTLYLTPDTTPEMAVEAFRAGVVAGKLYPKGATTGAQGGVPIADLLADKLDPVFEAMRDAGMVLSIHGEDPNYEHFEREDRFLIHLQRIAKRFGRQPWKENEKYLKISLEHISRRRTLEYLEEDGYRLHDIRGSVTLVHLLCTVYDVALNHYLACMPIAKDEDDRRALVERVVLKDTPWLYFGGDSAPHPNATKEVAQNPSTGVYSEPVNVIGLVQLFERCSAPLERLINFTSKNAADRYGFQLPDARLRLKRAPHFVPNNTDPRIFLAGETLEWAVQGIST